MSKNSQNRRRLAAASKSYTIITFQPFV